MLLQRSHVSSPSRLLDAQVICGDCVSHLRELQSTVDLVFADPPYNIGFSYDTYEDRRTYGDYVEWTQQWIGQVALALKQSGSAYLMIGDEYAAETRIAIRCAGLQLRSWIIWSYTFGQHRHEKWARSHVHLFHAVKDSNKCKFNDVAIRVPSRRGLVYGDKRTNPAGRVPADTWDCYSRLCGNFRARQGWHGCQVPEELLARAITASTDHGDLVVDPFAGSGGTGVVARKYRRRFLGIEVSSEYTKHSRSRIAATQPWTRPDHDDEWNDWTDWELARFYREAGQALDVFVNRQGPLSHFAEVFNRRLETRYAAEAVASRLLQLASRGLLAVV